MQLFQPGASWMNAASHVHVFKVYAGMWDGSYAASDLSNMIGDRKSRHISLATEWGPLVPVGGCGTGIEGFDGANALTYAQIISSLGGTLQYIAFDEPESWWAIHRHQRLQLD